MRALLNDFGLAARDRIQRRQRLAVAEQRFARGEARHPTQAGVGRVERCGA